jgi:hypothetical protein
MAHKELICNVVCVYVKPTRTEQGDIVLQVDVLVYFLACFFRYVAVVDREFVRLSVPASTTVGKDSGIDGQMNASRRSQLVDPEHPSGLPSPDVMYSAPISRWKHGVVFLTLLEKYLEFFFPAGSDTLTNQSELFLWLAVDYWIDTAMVINRDIKAIAPASQGLQIRTPSSIRQSSAASSALKSCSDALLLDFGKNHLPPSSALEAAYLMLCHIQRIAAACTSSTNLVVSVPIGEKHQSNRTKTSRKIVYALPRALEILQQPIFDLLRACFASFDALKQQQQLMVLAIWLRWIQPWKYVDSDPGSTNILGSSSAVYSSEWRPYVALNMHFYTSLFVSFLRASVHVRAFDDRSASSSGFSSPVSSTGGIYYQTKQQVVSTLGSTFSTMDASISKTLGLLVDAALDVYQPSGGIAVFEDLDAMYTAVQLETSDAGTEGAEIHSVFRKSFMPNTPASSQKNSKQVGIDTLQRSPMNLATPVGVRTSSRQRDLLMSAETPQSRRRVAESPLRAGRFSASIVSPGAMASAIGGSKAVDPTGWSGTVGSENATYYPGDHSSPITPQEIAAIMKSVCLKWLLLLRFVYLYFLW